MIVRSVLVFCFVGMLFFFDLICCWKGINFKMFIEVKIVFWEEVLQCVTSSISIGVMLKHVLLFSMEATMCIVVQVLESYWNMFCIFNGSFSLGISNLKFQTQYNDCYFVLCTILKCNESLFCEFLIFWTSLAILLEVLVLKSMVLVLEKIKGKKLDTFGLA